MLEINTDPSLPITPVETGVTNFQSPILDQSVPEFSAQPTITKSHNKLRVPLIIVLLFIVLGVVFALVSLFSKTDSVSKNIPSNLTEVTESLYDEGVSTEATKEQAPMLTDLNLDDHTVEIVKRVNNNAYLNVRRLGDISGYYIVAELQNGKWVKLIEGQDVPSCELRDSLKIPPEIIDCHDEEPL